MEDLDKIILGLCLQHRSATATVAASSKPDYFRPNYRKFASLALAYFKKYKTIPTWAVLENHLKSKKVSLEMLLSFQKIYDDAMTVTAKENEFQFYFEKFKNAYLRESLKEALVTGSGVVDLLEQNDPFGAWEQLKGVGLEFERAKQSDDVKRGNIKDSVDERLNKYYDNQKNPNKAYGLLTGFKPLDDATHGLKGGEVLVIAGRPGSGKSICSLVMGKNAYKAGRNILFISIEMPKEQVELRFDASYTGLEMEKIELGKLEPEREAIYKAALDEMKTKDNFFYIIDSARCTPMSVESELTFLIESSKRNFDLIVIDYLGIMKADVQTKSDNEEQARIIEAVRNLARRFIIPVIIPVQLNRDLTKHRKGTERLSRSDVIGQTADVVMQIDEKDEDDSVAKLDTEIVFHVVKNRKGKSGFSFSMFYNPATMTIEDRNLGDLLKDLDAE